MFDKCFTVAISEKENNLPTRGNYDDFSIPNYLQKQEKIKHQRILLSVSSYKSLCKTNSASQFNIISNLLKCKSKIRETKHIHFDNVIFVHWLRPTMCKLRLMVQVTI